MLINGRVKGQKILNIWERDPSSRAQALTGCTLRKAQARGKHLLIDFSNEQTLHTHLGMTGSWHLYQRGEPWQKPRHRAAIAFGFTHFELVCFSPKLIRLDSHWRIRGDAALQRLGPDLLDEEFDEDAAMARLRAHNLLPIGEALMNQQLLSGIGNVYKSEVLFIERLNPLLPLSHYDDETLRKCLQSARYYMRRNMEGWRRKFRGSTHGDRLWVYRREGTPCLECGTLIAMRRQGDAARSTYFCPQCQQVGAAG